MNNSLEPERSYTISAPLPFEAPWFDMFLSAAVPGAASAPAVAVASMPAVDPRDAGSCNNLVSSTPLRRSGRVATRSARAAAAASAPPVLEPVSPPARSRGKKRKAPCSGGNAKRAPKDLDTAEDLDRKPSAEKPACTICLCVPDKGEAATIDGCVHRFCFECIGKWSERENSCPLCKSRFSKIARVQPKHTRGSKNTKKVKQRDQRSDFVTSAALESLLASFAASGSVRMNSATLSRFLLARVRQGGGLAVFPGRTVHPFRFDSMLSSDDSEDEDMHMHMHHPFGTFANRHAFPFFPPSRMPQPAPPPTMGVARSFAVNGMDSLAGNGLENPLEIHDSDDDDDDVEVLQVTRSAP